MVTQHAPHVVPGRTHSSSADAGVSEVVGSIMMVGMTLLLATAFVLFLVAAKPGPIDETHAELMITLSQGEDRAWDTSDDAVVVFHRGGEGLHQNNTAILVSIGAVGSAYCADASRCVTPLDGGFSDGRLDAGEAWQVTGPIGLDSAVSVEVVQLGSDAHVVASASLRSGQADCSGDVHPPSVLTWTQAPSDVRTDTAGNVAITLRALDDCSGVDGSVAPTLYYRLNDGSDPPYATASPAPMSAAGAIQWQAAIPEPAGGWAGAATDVLQYYVDGLTDLNGNTLSGPLSVRSDVVQIAGTYTYVTGYADASTDASREGTLTDFATLDEPDGVEATAQEDDVGTAPSTRETALYDANDVVSPGGFTNAANAFASDDSYAIATLSGGAGSSTTLRLGFRDQGSEPGTIVAVILHAEVRADTTGSEWRMQACTSTCNVQSSSLGNPTTDAEIVYNITALPPSGSWTSWSELDALEMRLEARKTTGSSATFYVDHAWLEVQYDTFPTTLYSLDVTLDIDGVPSVPNHWLELQYRVAGDAFGVQVWNWTSSSWRAAADDLVAVASATYTLALQPDELAGGTVQVRLVDAQSSTDQGSALLDYVRVVST